MKLVLVVVALLCVGIASTARPNNLYKTKRIIKVRVPPRRYVDTYKSLKGYSRPGGSPIRFKEYHNKHPEFSRPNHLPYYNGFNNVYLKHQSRPPPPVISGSGFSSSGSSFSGAGFGQAYKGFTKEIHHKFPLSYGSGFPHKGSFSSFKFPSLKEEIRITQTQTYAQPASTPVQTPTPIPAPIKSHASSSSSSSSQYSNSQYNYAANAHTHVQSSDDNRGPIREIPAPNLGPKSPDNVRSEEYATYGKGPSIDVTNLVTDSGAQQLSFPATEYYSAFGQPQHYEIIHDNALSTSALYSSGYYKNDQVAAFGDGAVHNAVSSVAAISTAAPEVHYKSNELAVTPAPAPAPSSGYEVTEEHHTASEATGGDSSNGQFYYAPDPDPSLPVHKVPPTKEVFTDESLAETYVPQLSQNFQILEGGTVAAPLTRLSTQELFNLMHGFPTQIPVVAEPLVTIISHHQQPAGVYLQPTYQYTQTGTGSEQYSHTAGSETQYQQQTDQSYVTQQQYATSFTQTSQEPKNYATNSVQSNYDYEPEASESQKSGNFDKMDEDAENVDSQQDNRIIIHFNKIPEVPFYTTLPNKKAAETLATLQAAGSIGSNYVDKIKTVQEEQTEVTIPQNVAAAVFLRGDQGPDQDVDSDLANVELPEQNLESVQNDRNKFSVEIQKSIPLYETSYAASSLLDSGSADSDGSYSTDTVASTYSDDSAASGTNSEEPESNLKTESFGKRIRPK